MNPNPFAVLNHFTVPFGICLSNCEGCAAARIKCRPRSATSLRLLRRLIHQAAKLLRLKGKGVHLQLCMPTLDLQCLPETLCLGKLIGHGETCIEVLLGEPHYPLLNLV